MPPPPPVILASGSIYRRELLSRLLDDFGVAVPDIDESRRDDEAASAMAARLAREKARAIAARRPAAVVIGSDQVPALGKEILRKPGDTERARTQLMASSGKAVSFFTAVCVVDAGGTEHEYLDETRVVFRTLSATDIDRYLAIEKPFDCAGSFKAEGLGIALFERIESIDPTALQGLPLIWLSGALGHCGVDPLQRRN